MGTSAAGGRLILRAAEPSEDDLHRAVARALDVLLLPPAVWTTFPAGHVPLPPAMAAKLMRLGLKRGWPDILILHAGRTHGIELKPRDGELSRTRTKRTRRGSLRVLEGQRDVLPKLRAAGMVVEVCRSLDSVLACLQRWEIPTRRAASPV